MWKTACCTLAVTHLVCNTPSPGDLQPVNIVAGAFFIVGSGILGGAVNIAMLVIGRVLLGVGVGLCSLVHSCKTVFCLDLLWLSCSTAYLCSAAQQRAWHGSHVTSEVSCPGMPGKVMLSCASLWMSMLFCPTSHICCCAVLGDAHVQC